MRAKYTKEFRDMAVELSYNTDKPISNLCKELNIGESALYKWRSKMNPEKKEISQDSKEMKELKKRLEKLEVENQILKKALAICNKI
ncbi:MAG: transposase [Candidatus Sericytochromatia bacterium]